MRIVALATMLVGLTVGSSGPSVARGQNVRPGDSLSSQRVWPRNQFMVTHGLRTADRGTSRNAFQGLPEPDLPPAPQGAQLEPSSVSNRSLGIRPVRNMTIDIDPPPAGNGELTLPHDYAGQMLAEVPSIHYADRPYRPTTTFAGLPTPADFCHYPLYFEQVNLERYGHTYGLLQPAFDAAHFFGTIPALPYMMGVEPPRQCVDHRYAYEAGRHAPWHYHSKPLQAESGLLQAGLVIGLILVLP